MLPVLRGCIFFSLLSAASVIDAKTRIIPDSLCAGIAASGLILFAPFQLSGVIIALPFLIAALTCGGMGGGDIKLMAAVGFFLGLDGAVMAAVVGLALYTAFYACYAAIQSICGRERQRAFPLAPFLAVGCMSAFLTITIYLL